MGVFASGGIDAYQLVVDAYSTRITIDGEAVVSRTLPGMGGQQTYKLEFNKKSQQVRIAFIHPSSMQGLTILDDLKTKQTFIVRRNLIVEEESPFVYLPTDSERKALLKKNYWIKWKANGEVSGRKAHKVELTPKNRDLYKRTLWIDSSSKFLMRHYLEDGDRDSELFIKTVSLDLTGSQSESFRFESNSDTRRIQSTANKSIPDPTQFRLLTGFSIKDSVSLPYGMVEVGRHVVARARGGHSVARVQLTDGIGDAYLWVWMTKGTEGRETLSLNGVSVPVFGIDQYGVAAFAQGDFPEDALKRLAREFLQGR